MTMYTLALEGSFLAASVELEEKEFKVHTDNYETETIEWDTITFE